MPHRITRKAARGPASSGKWFDRSAAERYFAVSPKSGETIADVELLREFNHDVRRPFRSSYAAGAEVDDVAAFDR